MEVCNFSWEGATAFSDLLKLKYIDISSNPGVMGGCFALGRLPKLSKVFISTNKPMQLRPMWWTGLWRHLLAN